MEGNYAPRFSTYEGRAHVRVFGPIQQQKPASDGYWAGQWTADELERFGVEAIQFAHDMRRQESAPKAA